VAPVFAVLGAGTIPWTVYLALTLPSHARTQHYRLAWVGFDTLLIVILLATALAAWRARPLVGLLAAGASTMLIVDAWFDITTSSPPYVTAALLSAAFAELPLAALCAWIALHVDQVVARRLRQLASRKTDTLPAQRIRRPRFPQGRPTLGPPGTATTHQPGTPAMAPADSAPDGPADGSADHRANRPGSKR
jgi:hypothetical protein